MIVIQTENDLNRKVTECFAIGSNSPCVPVSEFDSSYTGTVVSYGILRGTGEILKNSKNKTNKLFDNYHSYHQEKINLSFDNNLNDKMKNSIKKISSKIFLNKQHLRCLVRESGTEPLLRLLVEGKDKVEVKKEIDNLSNNVKAVLNV